MDLNPNVDLPSLPLTAPQRQRGVKSIFDSTVPMAPRRNNPLNNSTDPNNLVQPDSQLLEQQQQSTGQKKKTVVKSYRSNHEWRKVLMECYTFMFETRHQKKHSLLSYCRNHESLKDQHYKRLTLVWREMKIDVLLNDGVEPSDAIFVDKLDQRFPIEGGKENVPKRTRTKQKNTMRSNEEWRRLIVELYDFLISAKLSQRKESVRSYCLNVLKCEASYRRIHTVWTELKFDIALSKSVPPGDGQLKAALENKFPVTTRTTATRDLEPTSQSYFDANEEQMLCETVGGFARAGFPLEKANLKNYVDEFLDADGIGTGRNSSGGVSMDTVERIYKQGNIKATSNANPIDPKRAAQAAPEVLNSFYHQVVEWVKIAHEVCPDAWPEERYANIPPTRIYNTDEQGPNPTHLRNPVLVPLDMIRHRTRIFQNTREGDGKMQFHYTVANIVRADGIQCHPDMCVEGAPPPYILISDASSANDLDKMDKAERDKVLANQSEADEVYINEAIYEGWFDEHVLGEKDDKVNPFGFMIRATPTGSMLKRTFYDFVMHFIRQLPHDQGKNGIGVILFLDWHCSRECPQTLIIAFFIHNVLIIVLPAKTSIWAQPCDNGKNELVGKDIAITAHDLGILAGNTLDHQDANKVFRGGLEKNCSEQNDEIRRTGSNAVVSSFKKTGLYPMDYDNEGWQLAFQNFNTLNELIKEQRREAGELMPEIIWSAKARKIEEREELSADDLAALNSFLPRDDFLQVDPTTNTNPIEIPPIILAMAVAEHMVGTYTFDENRDITKPPTPREPHEIAAMKLVEYAALTVNDRVDTTCTLTKDEIARDKLRTKLSVLLLGHGTTLRKKTRSNRKVSVTKQKRDKFLVIDGDRRDSRNLRPMTVAEIIDNFYDACDDDNYNLTKKDKRKGQKKARIARKRLNASLYEEATAEADEKRLKRNIDNIQDRLLLKRPQFAAKLMTILEEEELSLEDLYGDFESVVLKPYSDVIPVTRGDITKDIAVTRVGTDVSAVSHKMETTLIKLMIQSKASSGDKPKRRRRRGAGQSTQLGKCGVSVGILIQRQSKQEEMKELEKKEKTLNDEVDKMKTLLTAAEDLRQQVPNGFWKWDVVKGKRRTVLAKVMGVFKSSIKADDLAQDLKKLELTRASVETQIDKLRLQIDQKAAHIQPVVAQRREAEDFLAHTMDHAAPIEDPNKNETVEQDIEDEADQSDGEESCL